MGHESRGIGMHVRSLLEHLTPQPNVEYVVYTYDNYDPIVKLGYTLHVPYERVTTPLVKKSIDRPRDFAELSKIIFHKFAPLRNKNIDIFVQFDFMLGMPRFAGVKNVLIAYDLIPLLFKEDYLPTPLHEFKLHKGIFKKAKKFLRAHYYQQRYRLHYKNFSKANLILSISNFTSQSLVDVLDLPKSKIITIPLAPVINTQTPTRPQNIPKDIGDYLLYIGATDKRKRVQDLVDAFDVIKGSGKRIKLVLAGKEFEIVDKIPNLDIRNSIKKSKYKTDIYTLGFINDSEKLWLYQNAKCFVFPTLYEGFGIPVLEAFENSCAVVAYDNSSIPEVSDGNALLAKSGNVSDLTQKITHILDDPSLVMSVTKGGYEHSKQYSWRRYSKKFLNAIMDLYEKRS